MQDRSVHAPVDHRQEKGGCWMIVQPGRKSRNETELFYENETRRIAMLNEIFGNVELSEAEMQTLIWLAGWAENTVENVVSAIRKAMTADAKRRELPPRP